ncbi:hypothetical protein FMEXI_3175 [Fusarium mexicanum]|uniref:Uncharacterized protein n=1 Tax=Fusarium mexicanum TaxID=751941 RepID=A0A8H5JA95_9HYPO|nr:hypothetical protein FMEXI_3175 [Fusarium mexicanum]
MVAWLKSRAEAREKERRALVAQVAELDKQIQKDIDDAANWQMKAEKLAAKETESTIGDAFEQDGLCAAALVRRFPYSNQKQIELTDLKHKKTAEEKSSNAAKCVGFRCVLADQQRYAIKNTQQCEPKTCATYRRIESPYVSDIPAVPRLVANTQFAQRVQSPPFPLKTLQPMPPKKPTMQFSNVPLAVTTNLFRLFGDKVEKRCTYRTTPSSTEHIKILEGMGF